MKRLDVFVALLAICLSLTACKDEPGVCLHSRDKYCQPCHHLPDDDFPECPEGYFCLINICEKDQSLPLGATCLEDKNCKEGLICPVKVFACSQKCNSYYSADACESDRYCAPRYDYYNDDTKFMGTGACLRAECTAKKADVPEDGTDYGSCAVGDCVFIKKGVGKCFETCKYFIDDSGKYTDNLAAGKSCHPMGEGANFTMVVLPSGTKAESENCDPVTNPCAKGLVCIKGAAGEANACHKLCANSNDGQPKGCSAEQHCVAIDGATDFAYCRASSN